MAKKSAVEKNKNRAKLVDKCANRKARLLAQARDKNAAPEERFAATLKLAEMPRNGHKIRLRNRCEVNGRPRGYYRYFKMSRVSLRHLASFGMVPGVIKSSW